MDVTEGVDLVQSCGGEIVVMHSGDTVWTRPASGSGTALPMTTYDPRPFGTASPTGRSARKLSGADTSRGQCPVVTSLPLAVPVLEDGYGSCVRPRTP
jgi:hypothetical protein